MAAGDGSKKISRREVLRSAGLAGAAAAFPGTLFGRVAEGEVLPDEAPHEAAHRPRSIAEAPPPPRARNLTVAEREVLDAMIGRLIPSDDLGPGAREAGALDFIDRELGGALSDSREAYRTGLAALDRYSEYARGARFVELPEAVQDSVLFDLDTGGATGAGVGFVGSSASFFNMVQSHVWQATFGDPYYGGNREFIGWDLIRYPGPRRSVSAAEQGQLESEALPMYRRSAYE